MRLNNNWLYSRIKIHVLRIDLEVLSLRMFVIHLENGQTTSIQDHWRIKQNFTRTCWMKIGWYSQIGYLLIRPNIQNWLFITSILWFYSFFRFDILWLVIHGAVLMIMISYDILFSLLLVFSSVFQFLLGLGSLHHCYHSFFSLSPVLW